MTQVFTFVAANPIMLLFILMGVGMVFGHIKVRGVSLGAAAVLFFAIVVSALGHSSGVDLTLNPVIGTLGLALFAFAIGVSSGPNFFHALRSSLWPILATVVLLIAAGALAYYVGTGLLGMPVAEAIGTYAGALTNTPALSAAGKASGNAPEATVGYSIAYLFGVIGMLGFSLASLAYRRTDTDTPTALDNRTVRVERGDKPRVGDLEATYNGRIAFSRLRRGETGPVARPKSDDRLNRGDLVTIVGPKDLVARAITELGHSSSHSLIEDRRFLDFRRITVSDPKLAGHTIEGLELDRRFSATASRVRRGDTDMMAEPGLVLQLGDRVRVVAPRSQMSAVTKFFGDSAKGLSDINPIALGLGMALGILIGELPIFTPTGATFSIGSAAGTLLVGLVFGRIGRIGSVVTALPHTATQVLTELGLLVFLAQAGTNAGSAILTAFTSGAWVKMFLLGLLITGFVGIGLYVIMRYGFGMGGTRLSGLMGGAQTQPAILAFANTRTGFDPRVALGYAMVYPMAMITKILVAQVFAGM
ncbi:transporter [Nanchangia anserum]|uniref:Transporter n=1 Tax=Nanchangia anserum TaxID=2692125 RepID=A0A8I0GD80_9ACTO|nr:TrkA C-terminal domain-containing protein [Nanchangia anserum]MBD3689403.1 transporter [Nanchangia anserum]QOX81610.1 transporter [Nanchangia anserum]